MELERWFPPLLLGVLLSLVGSRQVFADVTINPDDDSFVRVSDPTSNFDEDAQTISVTAEGFPTGSPEDIGYLRFDVSGLSGTLTSARLRVYNRASPGPSVTVAVFDPGSDDWNGGTSGIGDETTLTYNDAPAPLGGTQLDSQAGSAMPAYMEFDSASLTTYVDDQIAGDGLVTFLLRVTSTGLSDLNFFEDRENTSGSGNLPELVLEGVDLSMAVELIEFGGAREPDGSVTLRWRTASEFKHAGFRVWREEAYGHEFLVTPQLIPPSSAGELGGGSYVLTDPDSPIGALRYWLEDVDVSGHATRHGPVTIDRLRPGYRTLPLPPRREGAVLQPIFPMPFEGLRSR